jgi:hypothetical protein
MLALLAPVCAAQNTPRVALDTSETLFTILASINACGYDQELNVSHALRAQIRSEIARVTRASDAALQASNVMCQYYREHAHPDPSKDFSQYVSLALYLGDPPNFVPKVQEVELPPDAANVVGFAKLAATYWEKAGLHAIWQRHRDGYARLTEQYHQPISKMLFDTEIYLKVPSAGYLGRGFTVYLDPLGAPGVVSARNYGQEYYVVISPGGSGLKMDQIRHTYLHYLLDPLSLKYPSSIKRLEPLLDSVRRAPMDEAFKTDTSLLVTECFVRAIEIRSQGTTKTPEILRADDIAKSMEQGFILTRYFYDALIPFEKDPVGIRNTYADMLNAIDLKKEARRASEIQFASEASPELLHFSRPNEARLVRTAEKRLAAGDLKSAQELAQEALNDSREDKGRALFVMAQIATANKDMTGAAGYFEQALQTAQEPKVVVWSHIYLGRIYDLQEHRDTAVTHYRAALSAAGSLPEAKAAAERGLQQPYEPPAPAQ